MKLISVVICILTNSKNFCDNGWTKKHGFVVINIWEEPYCGRYIAYYENIYTKTNTYKYPIIPNNT